MVSHCYLTQTAPKTTPSGFHTLLGRLPGKFPPSVIVAGASPVGSAILCQRSWTDPSVIECAQILLGDNHRAATDAINCHRMEALKIFKLAYNEQMQAEIKIYGKDSYFNQVMHR